MRQSQGESKSPAQGNTFSPTRPDSHNSPSARVEPLKPGTTADAEPAKPLAPPPRPAQAQQNGNTPDYFGGQPNGSLSLEPNPFEQSFGGAPSEGQTPGGTKLPPVAALTSPSSLLPNGVATPFNWGGGSLRTGPLSPAMLSGPANDYFGDTHLRGGFPTPNESSLRTGLTPGGSGSMFPVPSPSSQTLFAQIQGGSATPSTLDFHRTAMSAAAAKREQQQAQRAKADSHQQPPTVSMPAPSQPAVDPSSITSAPGVKAEAKPPSGSYDPHDNDAANGLFMLAQGHNSTQPQAQFAVPPPPDMSSSTQGTSVPLPVPNGSMAGGQTASTSAPQPTQRNRSVPQPSAMGNGTALMNGRSPVPTSGPASAARAASDAGSAGTEDSEPSRSAVKGKGKRASTSEAGSSVNGRRKASDAAKNNGYNKKAKTSSIASNDYDMDSASEDEDSKLGPDDQPKQKMTEEEKRRNFLERNRVAALKCRQRKKQWLQNLQTKVELYSTENESLSAQITQLREEVVNLKTLLLAHKDCPVTQQQGMQGNFMQHSMEPYNNTQINPYGMTAAMPGAVMAEQRRFS